MRRLVWLAIVFAVLWSGWWLIASFAVQNGIATWLDDRRAEGWQADVAGTSVSGFPLYLDATLANPALADPQTGVAFTASSLRIKAPAWSPGTVSVIMPDDEMVLSTPIERYAVLAEQAVAKLHVHSSAAEVGELSMSTGAWSLSARSGTLIGAQSLDVQMVQDTEDSNLYAFSVNAPAFQPGDVIRKTLRLPTSWPQTFDNLLLDMSVRFDRPFDRRTIEDERPQPRHIDLRMIEAAWGSLLIRFAAELDVSGDGLLSGDVALQARNWRDILDIAENAGVLPGPFRPQLENILAALARGSGNPDAIDVTLSLRDGSLFMGFIPLGPVPRLVIR